MQHPDEVLSGVPKLVAFGAARYLTDDAAVAEYITAVLEPDAPDLLLLAPGDVARAWDGTSCEGLRSRARESAQGLAPDAKPRSS